MSEVEPTADEPGPRLKLHLKLFIAAGEPNSTIAEANLRQLQRDHFQWDLAVEVVNVLEDYQTALENRVLVTPCLVLDAPSPRAMVVGTLSDREKVMVALRLVQQERSE